MAPVQPSQVIRVLRIMPGKKGTPVDFYFNQRQTAGPAKPVKPPPPRVLLCFGDMTVRPLMRALCDTCDFAEIHEAETASQAFKILLMENGRIDIVLCGPLSHVDTGTKLARAIRVSSADSFRKVPLIMVASNPVAKDIAEARDAGVTEFLTLPVSKEILMKRVEQAIAKPRDFVAVRSYAGPDRRRRKNEYKGPERRGSRKPKPQPAQD